MRVVVGLSGGVDSTVSAYLLQQMGYEVEGVYMKLHNIVDNYHEKNIENVKKVSEYLGIKYHIVDFTVDFKNIVYDYFINDYKDGLTPNPCVLCNRFIKFGKLLEFAKSIGCEKIATGHYAKTDGQYIYKGFDSNKDQSYFISYVSKDVLRDVIFPLGDMIKDDVKNIANSIEVLKDIAQNKESNEICFVENTYVELLQKHYNMDNEGKVRGVDGQIIGTHKGYMHYTIGKRKGFTIQASVPHYVVDINPLQNEITVAPKENLIRREFCVRDLNMFVDSTSIECSVKVRYRTTQAKCTLNIVDKFATITLHEDVSAITKGQTAVFYDNDKVIGSGWII